MVLFFSNKKCDICGDYAIFKARDGVLCGTCVTQALGSDIDLESILDIKNSLSVSEIRMCLENNKKNKELRDIFTNSVSYGPLSFDFKNMLFKVDFDKNDSIYERKINHKVFRFKDVLLFSAIEDENILLSGGNGMDISENKIDEMKANCCREDEIGENHSIEMMISFKDLSMPQLRIPFEGSKSGDKIDKVYDSIKCLERGIESVEYKNS